MSVLSSLNLTYPADLDYVYYVDAAGKSCRQSLKTPIGYQGRFVIPPACEEWNKSGKVSVALGDTIVMTPNYMSYYYNDKTVGTNDYSAAILGSYYYTNNSSVPVNSSDDSYTPTGLNPGTSILDVHHYDDGYFENNCYCSNTTTGNVGGVNSTMCGNLYSAGTCNSDLISVPPTIPSPTPVINIPTQQLSTIFWILIVITGIVILAAIIIAGLVIFGVFKGGEKVLEAAKESAEGSSGSSKSPPKSKGSSVPPPKPSVSVPSTGAKDASLSSLSGNIF